MVNLEVELSTLGTITPPFSAVVSSVGNYFAILIGDRSRERDLYQLKSLVAPTKIISESLEDKKVSSERLLR